MRPFYRALELPYSQALSIAKATRRMGAPPVEP
jgi:hypothetical protein